MSKRNASDLDWEKFGQSDPYFGVCSDEIFKSSSITEDALSTFFESGKTHVNQVLNTLGWMTKEELKPKSVLDYGCGTGRLVIPFSSIAESVIGVDVSPSMLQEVEKNAKKRNITNIRLIQSNSLEILGNETFDLVHTFIVLQHIPVSSGYGIIQSLLNAIKPKGHGMIHFTYRNERSLFSSLKDHLRSDYRFIAQLTNIMKGKRADTPFMQMNNYNLNRVFRMIEEAGISKFHTEFTNHNGFHGVSFYLHKG